MAKIAGTRIGFELALYLALRRGPFLGFNKNQAALATIFLLRSAARIEISIIEGALANFSAVVFPAVPEGHAAALIQKAERDHEILSQSDRNWVEASAGNILVLIYSFGLQGPLRDAARTYSLGALTSLEWTAPIAAIRDRLGTALLANMAPASPKLSLNARRLLERSKKKLSHTGALTSRFF